MKRKTFNKALSLLLALVMQLTMILPAYAAGEEPVPTQKASAESILANCKVDMMQNGQVRTAPFRETETSVDVSVKLDESVPSCYMTIFSYSGNTAFDPDSSFNTRLWQGKVENGTSMTCEFQSSGLPLNPGDKVIACLNVLVDPATDFYRPVNSTPLEVVDKNGEGFQDYVYPDAFITEKSLAPGAEKLHVSLTGDARIFQAAKEKKTSVNVAIAQYPAEDAFDFESEKQISLCSLHGLTEPLDNKEILLSEPLKEGYRVRAVVYWEQNVSLRLVKGNDYESYFQRPDDSILIGEKAPISEDSIKIVSPVSTKTKSVSLQISGCEAFKGGRLILTTGPASLTDPDSRTQVGNVSFTGAGSYEITVNSYITLKEGETLLPHLYRYDSVADRTMLKKGEAKVIEAEKEPVKPAKDFEITLKTLLTEESTKAVLSVKPADSSISLLNAVRLYKADATGKPDTSKPVAQKFGQKPGEITLDLPAGSLKNVKAVFVELVYKNASKTFLSDSFSVGKPAAADQVLLKNKEFTTDSVSASVEVTGCDPFKGGYLILTMGPASQTDIDSRTQVGSVSFTGAGAYTVPFSSSISLKAGETILAHLYRYDSAADKTMYKRGNQAPIKAGEPVKPAKDFEITLKTPLTPESTQADFSIKAYAPGSSILNIVKLCKAGADGKPDTSKPLSQKYGVKPGDVSFTFSAGSLKNVDKVFLIFVYNNANSIFTSKAFPVTLPAAPDSVTLKETEFTTDSASAVVTVSGCEEFKGGRLILTTGSASQTDADSRTQIGNISFTGAGTYTVEFYPSVSLNAGDTILPHLYRYNSVTDRVLYKYGEARPIKNGEEPFKDASVSIATTDIRADRENIWVTTDFDSRLTGELALYTYEGLSFQEASATEIYKAVVTPSENSQKITFGSGKLTAGQKLIAVLTLSDKTSVQSGAKVIQKVPEKVKPSITITDKAVTAGDTHITASAVMDRSVSNGTYVLYQFDGETLNPDKDEVLSTGKIYRNTSSQMIGGLLNKLRAGSKLQIAFTVEGVTCYSNILTIEPSPDWGTPSIALDVNSVFSDAVEIPVFTEYDKAYLSLGENFYCDVTLYAFPGSYTDDEFVSKELWENGNVARRIGQINTRMGDETLGNVNIQLLEHAELKAGDRVIAKLRLPHPEWEDNELDYTSLSVPVLEPGQSLPEEKIVLYNLDTDTSRGNRLHMLLDELKLPYMTLEQKDLNQTVGYLAGLEGFEASEEFTGDAPESEFMLMCGLSENSLNRFLNAMQENGLRIARKALVTESNKTTPVIDLMDYLGGEHDAFTEVVALDEMIRTAEKLSEHYYGDHPDWNALLEAVSEGKELLASYEPLPEDLRAAYEKLKNLYLSVTGQQELTGTVTLEPEKDADGTYTLKAVLKDLPADAKPVFHWSNGQTGDRLTKVPAKKLIGQILTVTAEDFYGELTAQLMVPDAPELAVDPDSSSVRLSWKAPVAKDNMPLPETYTVTLFDAKGTLLKTTTCSGTDTELTLDGLDAETEYRITVAATNPAGRSDLQKLTVTTAKEEAVVPPVNPEVNPDPETKPNPEVKPNPETKPDPEVKPNPETKPQNNHGRLPQTNAPDWYGVMLLATLGLSMTYLGMRSKGGKQKNHEA